MRLPDDDARERSLLSVLLWHAPLVVVLGVAVMVLPGQAALLLAGIIFVAWMAGGSVVRSNGR